MPWYRATLRGVTQDYWEVPRQGAHHLRKSPKVQAPRQRAQQVSRATPILFVVIANSYFLFVQISGPWWLNRISVWLHHSQENSPAREGLTLLLRQWSLHLEGREHDERSLPTEEGPRWLPIHHLHGWVDSRRRRAVIQIWHDACRASCMITKIRRSRAH